MNKKAQAGLEYLITYGWAIALVAAVIGTLVLVVGTPLAESSFSSSDPTKLMIKGAAVNDQVATIKLQNITGGEIEVQSATGGNGYYDCEYVPTTVRAGGELEIKCAAPPTVTQGTVAVVYVDSSGFLQNTLLSGGGGTVPMGSPAPPTGENTDYLCSDGFNNDSDIEGDCEVLPCIDCEDPDCDGLTGVPNGALCEYQIETLCEDGFDNDADGLTDDADSDCVAVVEYAVDEIYSTFHVIGIGMGQYVPNPAAAHDFINTQSDFDFTTGCNGSCQDKWVRFSDGDFPGQDFRIMDVWSGADCPWLTSKYDPKHSCAHLENFDAVYCATIIDCVQNMELNTPWHFEILE